MNPAHPMPLWTPASRRTRSPSRAAATASFRERKLVRCRAAVHSRKKHFVFLGTDSKNPIAAVRVCSSGGANYCIEGRAIDRTLRGQTCPDTWPLGCKIPGHVCRWSPGVMAPGAAADGPHASATPAAGLSLNASSAGSSGAGPPSQASSPADRTCTNRRDVSSRQVASL